MKQGPRIDCGESRLRSAPKIAGGSLSGGGSLGGPSLYDTCNWRSDQKLYLPCQGKVVQ